MSTQRRLEIEEMDQWDLLELVESIRDAVWFGETDEAISTIRDLVGFHEDMDDEDDDSDDEDDL